MMPVSGLCDSVSDMLRFAFAFLAAMSLSACGTRGTCTAATCMGCCSRDDRCVMATDATACGRNGSSCNSCAAGQTCNAGACDLPGSTGGGTAGAGGSAVGVGGGNSAGGIALAGGAAGGAVDLCSDDAKLVYVVDSNGTFSSFNPREAGSGRAFTDKGPLRCPAMGGAQPFSMSVDRDAKAWVVYDDGELFRVDVNSLACTRIAVMSPSNAKVYGMGFVTDIAGGSSDTLYIAGNPVGSSFTNSQFGTLATTAPFSVTLRAPLVGSPELTGTGDAHLWAFFPNVSPPVVSELDKRNGTTLRSFQAPMLMGTPAAWAFAFWGGDFWIFLQRQNEPSTTVYRMNGTTGAMTTPIPDSGRRIVGAGVSTCAPIMIQ
jgi:hypothetical protein